MSRAARFVRETWPLKDTFTISRGSKSAAHVVVAEIEDDGHVGRGECVPYARYGETVDSVISALEAVRPALASGADRQALLDLLPPGAARNAVDCALWDLAAKQSGERAWTLAGQPAPAPATTAYTLSLGSARAMGDAARAHARRPLLKLKLDDAEPVERVRAVRAQAPEARLIVDANEAWDARGLESRLDALAALGVELVEQPLPADDDAALARIDSPVPIGADESCHTGADLDDVARRYSVVNIKLDKTGGLTEALNLHRAARERGLGIMVGCMVGTSLGMAPAMLLTPEARFVDLDGPLLLARDRDPRLRYGADGSVEPPDASLWG